MTIKPKQIGNFMICSCVGMAYFNAVSTLNLSPMVGFGVAAVPIALLGLWIQRSTGSSQTVTKPQPEDLPPDR